MFPFTWSCCSRIQCRDHTAFGFVSLVSSGLSFYSSIVTRDLDSVRRSGACASPLGWGSSAAFLTTGLTVWDLGGKVPSCSLPVGGM